VKRRTRRFVALAALALPLVITACSSSQSSGADASATSGGGGSLYPLNITYSAITAAYANVYVEQQEGLFAKNGLKVSLNSLQGSSELDAALVSGHSQIGIGPAPNSASAILKGIGLQFIGISEDTYNLRLWVADSITKPSQLAGKSIAAGAPNTESDYALTAYLNENHIPQSSVKRIYAGTTAGVYTAVESGAAVGTFSAPPNDLVLQSKGYHVLASMTSVPNATVTDVVSSSWLSSHKNIAEKFYNAEVQGLAYLRSHPAQTKAAIEKFTGVSNASQVNAAYQFFLGVWSKTPDFDSTSLSALQGAFGEAAATAKMTAPSLSTIESKYVVNLGSSGS
jgi:NitT/TauT family transport system substrate-binding protein